MKVGGKENEKRANSFTLRLALEFSPPPKKKRGGERKNRLTKRKINPGLSISSLCKINNSNFARKKIPS